MDDQRERRIALGFTGRSIPVDTRHTVDFDNFAGLTQMAMPLAQQSETGAVMAFRTAEYWLIFRRAVGSVVWDL